MMKGKIDMTARRQVTNKLRGQYRKASKADKGEILDRVVATTGMGRSTARRMLTGPRLSLRRYANTAGATHGRRSPNSSSRASPRNDGTSRARPDYYFVPQIRSCPAASGGPRRGTAPPRHPRRRRPRAVRRSPDPRSGP